MIDRGAKRAVWNDEDEEDREIELGDGNISKKIKATAQDAEMTGKHLEEKLRSQVSF